MINNGVWKIAAVGEIGQKENGYTTASAIELKKIPELNSEHLAQHIYSCSITLSGSLSFSHPNWNYLAGPTHSHMHVHYLQRTHTLQQQQQQQG